MLQRLTGPPVDGQEYIYGRRRQRVAGNGVAAAIVLPLAAACTARRPRFAGLFFSRRTTATPNLNLLKLWLPSHPIAAAAVGAAGGFLEDYHGRLAWADARGSERALEPQMWTARTVVPCLALLLNPLLAWKVLDGEMKGADVALATLEGRPAVAWPFFAVLLPKQPSDPKRWAFRYHHFEAAVAGREQQQHSLGGVENEGGSSGHRSGAWFLEGCDGPAACLHILHCRLWGGFYQVERRPENARWNLF